MTSRHKVQLWPWSCLIDRSRLLMLVLAVAALCSVLASDCGAHKNREELTESQAERLADKVYLTLLKIDKAGGQYGTVPALFTQECRGPRVGYNVAGFSLVRLAISGAADDDIEDFDVGRVKLQQTQSETQVNPVNPGAARVKVNGRWVSV